MNKKYFSYLFRSRKMFLFFYCILFLCFALSPFLTTRHVDNNSYIVRLSLNITSIGSGLLAFILPLWHFSFVHSRKSADRYFSLPLSRWQQFSTTCLFALTMSYGLFLLNATIALSLHNEAASLSSFDIAKMLVVPVALLTLLILFASACFLVANNLFDGFVMVLAYSVFPIFCSGMLSIFLSLFVAGAYSSSANFLIFLSPIFMVGKIFEALFSPLLVQNFSLSHSSANLYLLHHFWLCASLLVLYIFVAAQVCIHHFIKRKAERSDQISNEFFAYPLVIASYVVVTLSIITFIALGNEPFFRGLLNNTLAYLVIFFLCAIANFVYRRKIEIRKSTLLLFVASFVFAVSMSSVAIFTKGFGIAEMIQLPKEGLTVSYRGEFSEEMYQKIPSIKNRDVVFQFSFGFQKGDREKETPEFINFIQNIRQQAIDNFYEIKKNNFLNRSFEEGKGRIYGNLVIGTSKLKSEIPFFSHSNYRISHPLDWSQLEKLDHFGKLSFDCMVGDNYRRLTLQEFKKEFLTE